MAELLGREKQTVSALLKAQYGTESGKTQLNSLLDKLLSPDSRFNETTKEWCIWLMAGGENPKVFFDKLRCYDSSQTCGLVWHKNFIAYRCRDCGTSPCMSICADCFHRGDHKGHDYNMFRSQAGGACDCGDENVMKREGFCSSHGKLKPASSPPFEDLCMAKAVITPLFSKLYGEINNYLMSENLIFGEFGDDIDNLIDFFQEMSKGEILRHIVSNAITIIQGKKDSCKKTQSSLSVMKEYGELSCLDLLLDVIIKTDFPEKLVTFLLQLLPDKDYKVTFTQKFCEKYQEIGKSLTLCSRLEEVEQLSGSIVHVSVQLFSNQILVAKMVDEQNLLHIMVKVLHEMIRSTLKPIKVNDYALEHLVVDCQKSVIKFHCYWPVISDLINVLTHGNVAYMFTQDIELLQKWMKFLATLTGMNCNKRVITSHVEYEPNTHTAAYSIEIEACASPMWGIVAALSALNDKSCLMNIIKCSTNALIEWKRKVFVKPSRSEVSFHLPLFRYFSAFVRQAINLFNIPLQDLSLDFSLLTQIMEWPVRIQVAISEIRAGLWVRSGDQIIIQAAWYQQCHFCYSMIDLDIFFMQICAAQLDPDYILDFLLDRYRVRHWFEFHDETGASHFGIDDEVKEAMIEQMLTLIITLVTCRLHLGMTEEQILRLEIVTILCFADRTHSQLVNLVPERSSQPLNTQLFEKILKEISDYKNPGCDNNGMQQGMYTLKNHIWQTDFDPVHALLRAYNRRQFQAAMDRYTSHLRRNDPTRVGTVWPPFRPLQPLPESFQGILRLLHCKILHQILYFILNKATTSATSLPESLLYLTVHLITLATNSGTPSFDKLSSAYQPSLADTSAPACIVAWKCLNFLSRYGKHNKNINRNEDFDNVDQVLLVQLLTDPNMVLDINVVSVETVSLIFGHILNYAFDPPLFSSILPHMNFDILTSALGDSSIESEKEAQFLLMQFLLESLPVHRYKFIKVLVLYLVGFIEREGVPLKSISFVHVESQPVELAMLYMYLIHCHERLFRIMASPDHLPRDLHGIEFPSCHLIDNIHCIPEIKLIQAKQVSSLENSTLINDVSETTKENLIVDLMEITKASRDIAVSLLEQSQYNLEISINIYLEDSTRWSDSLSQCSSQTAMEVDSADGSSQTCEEDGSNQSHASSSNRSLGFNDSMLSLLIKLKTVLFSVTSPISPRSGVNIMNDGVKKIDELLESISKTCSDVQLQNQPPLSPTCDIDDPFAKIELKRKRARERQKKVMAEFASKQKNFIVANESKDESDENSDDCKRKYSEVFDCAICNRRDAPSSEEEPFGYVTFLQPGTVLKHRGRSKSTSELSFVSQERTCNNTSCGSVYSARKNFLSTFFDKTCVREACELGIDGGVRIQSCGHCLHLQCQQSYVRSLQATNAGNNRHSGETRRDEFPCPVCRRLGNALLPILPSDVLPSLCNQYKEMSHKDSVVELEMNLKKCSSNNSSKLTRSALLPSVLTASVSSLVDTIRRLDLSKEREVTCGNYHKFSAVVETARSNLEAEHIAIRTKTNNLCAKRHFYGALLQTLQYQSQSFSRPMFYIFKLLTGTTNVEDNKCKLEISKCEVPLLLRDGVSLLLQLMLSWPSPLDLRSFRCLVQIVFNVVCVQALIKTCCLFTNDERMSWRHSTNKSKSDLSTDCLLGYVCTQLTDTNLCPTRQQSPGISQSVLSPHTIETSIQKLCLPFLRLVSSLSYLCFSTDFPTVKSCENEFRLLTTSLGLSNASSSNITISDCFKWSHESPSVLIKKWCKQLLSFPNDDFRHEIFNKDLLPGMDEWEHPKLFPLPKHYDSLFQTYRKKRCERCQRTPDEPTLCLLCGAFLCLRGKCCEYEETRECVRHANECGYGTAIYCIVMSSSIFVIRGEKASVWGSVYLDEFGEEDIDLRRGKPLYLCNERYKRLQEQWITHNFDSICKTWAPHYNKL